MSSSDQKFRILCIDDEPDIREILKVSLSLEYDVVTAADGMEAVAMLDFCDADFIICDVRMPKMDGFQTVATIRQHPQYAAIPVFFLTAETGTEMAKKGFASGANLYLTKPFDPMRVLDNIRYFLKENGQEPRAKRLPVEDVLRKSQEMLTESPTEKQTEKTETPFQLANVRVIAVTHKEEELARFTSALSSHVEYIPCAEPLRALHELFQYEPDILIVNPGIPQLSGWGLAQMVRQNLRFRKMPILLIENAQNPIDSRLLPNITKLPLLPEGATPAHILQAVEQATQDKSFRIRPKKADYETLLQMEKDHFAALRAEQKKWQNQQETVRTKYERIQGFINKNMD